ncbi:MAG: VWA domain-containing protein [Terriglobia bacterium]
MSGRFKQGLLGALALLTATLVSAAPPFLAAQQSLAPGPGLPPRPDMALRVDVELVLLPVSVTDERYRAVSGLVRENFEVYEDKVRQEIASVNEADAPVSVGLVFDGSGSMADNIDLCKQAVRAFFQHANPEDEYFLIEFNDRPHLLVEFTSQTDRIMGFVGAARGGGSTAFYDAIYLALAQMEEARHSRKILLVLSDGADNHSRYSLKDVRNALRESDVQLYTIGVFQPLPYRSTMEQEHGPALMANLAELSGGHGFELHNPYDLPDVTATISRELRTQYEISYHPSNREHDGQWRKVRVKVKAPPPAPRLRARTRSGYYAPFL